MKYGTKHSPVPLHVEHVGLIDSHDSPVYFIDTSFVVEIKDNILAADEFWLLSSLMSLAHTIALLLQPTSVVDTHIAETKMKYLGWPRPNCIRIINRMLYVVIELIEQFSDRWIGVWLVWGVIISDSFGEVDWDDTKR